MLIDVTLRNADSFAGLPSSPCIWISPHQDVLFDSNAYIIAQSEEWKLESTLEDLRGPVNMDQWCL